MMKDFAGNLYDHNYSAQKANNDQIDDECDDKLSLQNEKIFTKYFLNIWEINTLHFLLSFSETLHTLQCENLVSKNLVTKF